MYSYTRPTKPKEIVVGKKKKYGNPLKQRAYEDKLRGDRAKELGQIYTPTALVVEMLDKLPKDSFDIGKTTIDPACGNGQFLAEVYQRKLNNGVSPLATLISTFGVELDKKEVAKCRARLYDILMDTEYGKLYSKAIRMLLRATIRQGNTLESPLEKMSWWEAPLEKDMKIFFTALYKMVVIEKVNIDMMPELIDIDGKIAYQLLAS